MSVCASRTIALGAPFDPSEALRPASIALFT
jgi:hypothetical protein